MIIYKVIKTYVDYRERNQNILNKLTEYGVDYELKDLPVGDYLWNGWVIERKQIGDFVSSAQEGRLYDQLDNMIKGLSEGAERAILFIHGTTRNINRHFSNPEQFFSMLGEVLVNYPKVNVIFVRDEYEFTMLLVSLYYKSFQYEEPVHTWVRKGKDLRLNILRSSGFSHKQATELLRHYTLIEIFMMPDKELKAQKYIGPATSKKFLSLRKSRDL